jgi:hypothetical protein
VSDLKPDRQRRDLHKSNLPVTSRKIGPVLIKYIVVGSLDNLPFDGEPIINQLVEFFVVDPVHPGSSPRLGMSACIFLGYFRI